MVVRCGGGLRAPGGEVLGLEISLGGERSAVGGMCLWSLDWIILFCF